MKNYFLPGLFIILLTYQSESLGFQEQSLTSVVIDTPQVIPDKKDFYKGGDFYFSGQPDESTLRWLADEGVKMIVNLRTEGEMALVNFDEINLINTLGMDYVSIHIGGMSGYTPEMVDSFAQALQNRKGKVLIHCAIGGRVTLLWMAYLVKYQGLSLNEAVAIGKRMKFTFPLEDLLGTKVFMSIEKK